MATRHPASVRSKSANGHARRAQAKHANAHGHHKHHRKRHRRKHHKPTLRPPSLIAGAPGAPVPTLASAPPSPSSAPVPTVSPSATATLANARRLLWRAGFGARPGQAEALAGQPLQQVVYGLTRPSGDATLNGPEPVDEEGRPLAPAKQWGHDHCWWLDRMVRSDQPLIERMTFIWHDWFANSNEKVNSQQLMLDQNGLFREKALGSFPDLLIAVTTNPAMLVFLDGIQNEAENPNENYAREMMELFSLGAGRGAYGEDDVRELTRALTGWRADWSSAQGLHNFRFDPAYHDEEPKTVFGQTGNWSAQDAVRLCVSHPLHASFFVSKLWGYFIATPPDARTLATLQGLYSSSGGGIREVVEAILLHPDFFAGPELVTPPVVYNAGLLRAVGRYIDTTSWAWLCAGAGQQLFYPPNVSGWDFARWLDTSTVKARWEIANYVTAKSYPDPWPQAGAPAYDGGEDATTAMSSALAYWANPLLSPETEQRITAFAGSALNGYTAAWQQSPYRAIRQNALRMLIATSPDMQVS
jgi:uncharacterized protein (DUF1800 family)